MKNTLNAPLIKQAILAAQANARQSTSHTKTRGEVSGGGKKPWKQKGTGRARAGSSRSPIWVGGGITFGPTNERNFKQSMPKTMARKALYELINFYNEQKKIIIESNITLNDFKTKSAVEFLNKHAVSNKKALIITNGLQANLVIATRNIPNVKVVEDNKLSILDIAAAAVVLIDAKIAEKFSLVKKEAAPKVTKSKTKAK